jgi:site-specific DNA-methyltransferase (adenine-specific)
MKVIKHKNIFIPENRQRKDFDSQYIVDLANSIERNGLINLPVCRDDKGKITLVAGECRLKAIEYLWNMAGELRYASQVFDEGMIPYNDLADLDPIDAYEIELEENIRRKDLTWQEKADATTKLMELRRLQAEKNGVPAPTVSAIAAEIRGTSGGAYDETRKELLVAKHLDDPDIAKAKSTQEAFKILKRKEELARSEELGRQVGTNFTSTLHSLVKADCCEWLPTLSSSSFDVILTDPPYGINAQDFDNADGKAQGAHFYDDSPENFFKLMECLAKESFRVAKPQAHLYLFCDVEHFLWLRTTFKLSGWKPFRTPLIWVNPSSQRAPWPDQGPHRKYQLILYATKGNRHVKVLRPDVLTFPSDDNLNHQAQKPVGLFADLLSRSCGPGDTVLDPFCGSGTIFPAAHELKVKATGCEFDPKAYGIAVERLGNLK